jgi:hypothetical protein
MRTFPLELLIIEILSDDDSGNLQARFERLLTSFVEDNVRCR